MPYDCFISYASADLAVAEALHRRLTAEGFTVWFDKARLEPGFDWHREIEDGCENSRVVLPVLTPRWKHSDWTKFETYGAEAVIPLLVEGGWTEVIPPPLERFQAETLEFYQGDAVDWARLAAGIRRVLGQPPPHKSSRVVHLHHLVNDSFVGREHDLLRIHEELHCSPRASATRGRVRAIASMGGAGKTTLARHYAEKFWRCYPQMLWVDCRLGLETEFAHLHDILFPESSTLGYGDADKAVRALLELQNDHTRLLVLDDADDEQSVAAWVPKTGGCHTLITSRFAAWSAAIKTIHLYVLDKAPSVQFLQNRAGRIATGAEHDACETLAEELGYLPLAMEQAAAYIAQQGEEFGFVDYLRLLRRATAELLAIGALGSTFYPDSVMTTWQSTMARLSPSARAVLSLESFLAPTQLPIDFLVAAAGKVQALADGLAPAPPGTPSDPEMFVRASLNDLKRYSVATFDGRSVSVHPLVQLAVRDTLPAQERAPWWKGAVSLLVPRACGHGFHSQLQDRWKPVLPHAEALHIAWTTLRDVAPSTELAEILRDCYYSLGRYNEALPFAQLAYDEDLAESGEGSPHAESSLSCLGILQEKRGDFAASAAAARRAREWASARLGERHPVTLRHAQNLAHALEKMGNADEASTLYRFVLDADPENVVALGNFAYMLQNVLGDYQQARDLYQRALSVRPDDVINLNNHAGLSLVLGDFPAAEASLCAAWRTASIRRDRFAARTLFFRTALACLRSEDPRVFLGQLKTVLTSGISPAASENVAVMRYLRETLAEEASGLLAAIFDAINDRSALDRLAVIPEWRENPSYAIDVPWCRDL
jgi:tetratricopeptide (TPR) repeat protein